jgi:23S rRNA pseudouridine1911/1915/1917 synthase
MPEPSRVLRLSFTVARADACRLDRLLWEELPGRVGRPLSRGQIRTLILGGVIHVEGRPERGPGHLVAPGARLTASIRLERLRRAASGVVPPPRILHDDGDLLAVSKPPGLLTHPSADPARPSLVGQLRAWLAEAGRDDHLGVHQRLDAETSGVIAFGRSAAADAALARQFAARSVGKTYHALTLRPARPSRSEWRSEEPLVQEGTGRSARMVARQGGSPATTVFRVLRVLARGLLVEARPLTGRKHQIRAHLAGAGLPILGDVRYGGPATVEGRSVRRVMLHAVRLEIEHPVTARALRIEAGYPADFETLLRELRSDEVPNRRDRRRGQGGGAPARSASRRQTPARVGRSRAARRAAR